MRTEYELIPDRVIWRGPEGSEVVLDEGGIRMLVPKWLEQADVAGLLQIVARAKQLRDAGGPLIPRPKTDAEVEAWEWRARQKLAAKAILDKIAPDDGDLDVEIVPF